MVTEAGKFKLSQQLVHVWLAATKKRCSPKFAVTIEKLTNYKVTRQQLRPDVFPPESKAA
jgi:DNA-binding transcriptional regulator YdaS (Cro superfamily)